MLVCCEVLSCEVHVIHGENHQNNTHHTHKQSRKTPPCNLVPMLPQILIRKRFILHQLGHMKQKSHKASKPPLEQKEGEFKVVPLANTGSHEGTVMVMDLDTCFTVLAVERAGRLDDVTGLTNAHGEHFCFYPNGVRVGCRLLVDQVSGDDAGV